MKNLFQTPVSVGIASTVSTIKPAPRVVERATVSQEDQKYLSVDADRFAIIHAAYGADVALWPAIASLFADGAPDWDNATTGDEKARARICAKAARKSILEQYNKMVRTGDDYVDVTTLPGSADTYIGELARGRQYGISPVTTSGKDGKPVSLMGWTVFSATVREKVGKKTPESADDCLVRLVKAWDTHKGSRVTSGIVSATGVVGLLAAIADAVGRGVLVEMLSAKPAKTPRSKSGAVAAEQQSNAPLHVSQMTPPANAKQEIVAAILKEANEVRAQA
jgi:hypothetical protein